jgi:hypothetical protein
MKSHFRQLDLSCRWERCQTPRKFTRYRTGLRENDTPARRTLAGRLTAPGGARWRLVVSNVSMLNGHIGGMREKL